MSHQNNSKGLGRRTFLAGAAAATVTIVKPSLVRGTQANSTVELGIIGCGGRGTWLMDLFESKDAGNYKFVACADYYPDHADRAGEKHGVEAARRYNGLSAYKKLLEGKLDAVLVESPPYFHPEHSAAAVDAGKHVYVAKPIAVDVPGCKSIGASGQKATDKKLVFLVDFQTRTNRHFQEAVKLVQAGDIGRLVCGEARYPWGVGNFPPPPTPEDRLRRWYCYRALSGDFIVEQNIHAIDVACWFLGEDPLSAVAVGGSKRLRSYGDIWDHFAVIYTFKGKQPSPFVLTYSGNQATPGAPDEIPCRIYGSRASVDTDYFSHVWVRGAIDKNKLFEAQIDGLYTNGARSNIRAFYKSIVEGDYANPTVPESVRSNLACVMGRNAAYKGQPITWEELMKDDSRLEPDLKGLKA
jgi:myo-inositol 2-dehydrogenase/D-chiro-inositol 1-dehydrogenase